MDVLKLRSAWAGLLARPTWDAFLTLTFDRQRNEPLHAACSERADRCFRQLVRYLNDELYGKRFLRTTPHKGLIWARAQEAHMDGVLHYHVCLSSPSIPFPQLLMMRAKAWWQARYGLARAERPISQAAVVLYLVKHVSQATDTAIIDLSHNYVWLRPRRAGVA